MSISCYQVGLWYSYVIDNDRLLDLAVSENRIPREYEGLSSVGYFKMESCRARSVYLTTRLLGRLSPLSG